MQVAARRSPRSSAGSRRSDLRQQIFVCRPQALRLVGVHVVGAPPVVQALLGLMQLGKQPTHIGSIESPGFGIAGSPAGTAQLENRVAKKPRCVHE